MKKGKKALIPAGIIAICFLVGGAVLVQRYLNIELTPKEVLAKSIENSTIMPAEQTFRHQVIENTGIFAEDDAHRIEAWAYGRNMRLDMSIDDEISKQELSMLISVFDERRCLFADGMENDDRDVCEYLYDRDMASFKTPQTISIEPQLVQSDDVFLLQWQTEKDYEMKNEQRIWAHFSMAGNSYIDAGTSIWNENPVSGLFMNQPQDGGYLHSVHVPYETEEPESDFILVQLEIKDKYSKVYRVNIQDMTVQELSEQELEKIKQQTLQDDKHEMETGDDMLDDLFGFYTMLAKEVLDNVADPIVDQYEERNGRQVLVQKYLFPESVNNDEDEMMNDILASYKPAETIEFVLDATELKIIGYSLYDQQGVEISSVAITVDEEIADQSPSEFFTEQYWKLDTGVK